jgi:hypothetical protein
MVALEERFVDLAFSLGEVEGMNAKDIQSYVRYIADWRLTQLKLPTIFGYFAESDGNYQQIKPPGCVHGGVIAAAFDQVLSLANVARGAAGPTAKLALRFRRPTPLHVPVRYEGWQTRVAGRRLHVEGRLLVDGDVTVEAEGVFVSMPRDRVMRMLDR